MESLEQHGFGSITLADLDGFTQGSTIALFDGVAITEFDGLPASASRFL